MEEGDVGKWGARCTVPTTTGGTWQCYNANGPAYAPNGRKKRDATGRWGAPTVPVVVCKLSCQGGYDLSGSYVAVCERNTGHWRRPVRVSTENLESFLLFFSLMINVNG